MKLSHFVIILMVLISSGCTGSPTTSQVSSIPPSTSTPSTSPQPTVTAPSITPVPSQTLTPSTTATETPIPTATITHTPSLTPAFTTAPGAWTGVVPAYKYLSGRSNPSAVWTGKEMIIWGGNYVGDLTNGALYNPVTDSWRVMSTADAPAGRTGQSTIWTGSRMIIWGGQDMNGILGDGARYNPLGNNWAAISAIGAPSPRHLQVAVWTGKEMIIWGGEGFHGELGDGARYDPSTNTWKQISSKDAPSPRSESTAVWTGSEMIVWGGTSNYGVLNTGARYNPETDTWTPVSITGAPSARSLHTAIWTGTEMIVWGGSLKYPFDDVNTGGRYNPATDTWRPVSNDRAPSARIAHTAVWTGKEMIIWGGANPYSTSDSLTGINSESYDPAADTWTALPDSGAPCPRFDHVAVWTGNEMIIWGGDIIVWPDTCSKINRDKFNRDEGARYTPPE